MEVFNETNVPRGNLNKLMLYNVFRRQRFFVFVHAACKEEWLTISEHPTWKRVVLPNHSKTSPRQADIMSYTDVQVATIILSEFCTRSFIITVITYMSCKKKTFKWRTAATDAFQSSRNFSLFLEKKSRWSKVPLSDLLVHKWTMRYLNYYNLSAAYFCTVCVCITNTKNCTHKRSWC